MAEETDTPKKKKTDAYLDTLNAFLFTTKVPSNRTPIIGFNRGRGIEKQAMLCVRSHFKQGRKGQEGQYTVHPVYTLCLDVLNDVN